MNRCELSFAQREPIDVNRAEVQHRIYESLLSEQGWEVRRLPASAELPDCVFIEDTAVILDEVAILTRPGAESRRAELSAVEEALRAVRSIARIDAPGTLDGGDVLRMGRRIFVGRSQRTNEAGIAQLRRLAEPFGYEVTAVPVRGVLHLKSAVTALGANEVLINVAAVNPEDGFSDFTVITAHQDELEAANTLLLDKVVMVSAAATRTRESLSRAGIRTIPVDLSELAKAEGGITCCSLLVR